MVLILHLVLSLWLPLMEYVLPKLFNNQLKVNENLKVDLNTGEVIKDTVSPLEDGSLELSENKLKEIDNKQVFNFKTNDKDFWSNNKSDAIEQMKEVFGSGDDAIFEYKDILILI